MNPANYQIVGGRGGTTVNVIGQWDYRRGDGLHNLTYYASIRGRRPHRWEEAGPRTRGGRGNSQPCSEHAAGLQLNVVKIITIFIDTISRRTAFTWRKKPIIQHLLHDTGKNCQLPVHINKISRIFPVLKTKLFCRTGPGDVFLKQYWHLLIVLKAVSIAILKPQTRIGQGSFST